MASLSGNILSIAVRCRSLPVYSTVEYGGIKQYRLCNTCAYILRPVPPNACGIVKAQTDCLLPCLCSPTAILQYLLLNLLKWRIFFIWCFLLQRFTLFFELINNHPLTSPDILSTCIIGNQIAHMWHHVITIFSCQGRTGCNSRSGIVIDTCMDIWCSNFVSIKHLVQHCFSTVLGNRYRTHVEGLMKKMLTPEIGFSKESQRLWQTIIHPQYVAAGPALLMLFVKQNWNPCSGCQRQRELV